MAASGSGNNTGFSWGGRPGGMLLRAMIAQNIGTGAAFGGLGVSVLALQARYDSSLAVAALALSLTVLALSGIGPFVAGLIARYGLRNLMCTGAATSMTGYIALAYAPNMALALAACGLLIGPGVALFSTLSPAVLAGSWFPHSPGKAMGITYLPLFATIVPLIGLPVIEHQGLKVFFLLLAAAHLAVLPLLWSIVEPETGPRAIEAEEARGSFTLGKLFWLIVVGYGILSGMAIAGATHILPIVTGSGSSLHAGAVLLAVTGAAAVPGSLLAGYLSDTRGPAQTFVLTALAFAAAWSILAFTGWLPAMTVAAILIGMGSAAIFPPLATLTVELFGSQAQPKILGLLGMMTLPFTFAISPGEGWLRDFTGSYEAVFVLSVAGCLIAMVIFFGISLHMHKLRAGNPPCAPAAT